MATHTDKEHIHSHFIINSVSCDAGKKYHSNRESLEMLWAASDKLCLEYGLPVVKPKKKQKKEHTMSDREYRAYDKGQSWKMDLELAIDECMTLARDREHFIRLMEYTGYEVRWEDSRKYITFTTPAGYKCRDSRLNGMKYHKEAMEYEFRVREEICRRNAGGAARKDLAGGNGGSRRGGDGKELGGPDRVAEGTGQDLGRDSGDAGYPDHRGTTGGVYESAAANSAGGWGKQQVRHGAVPAGADAGSAERHQHDGEYDEVFGATGWENERGIWERNLTGAGTDEAYFEEAVLDFHDSQPDLGSLGTDAAYLVAGLTSIIDDRPVEDSTTKHFRPERKKRHEQSMGGM